MMPGRWLLALALWCLAGAGAAGDPRAEVVGVLVVAPGKDLAATLRPFGYRRGTRVALLVRMGAGTIVHFDPRASRIDSFSDDKGSDLGIKRTGMRGWSRSTRFGPFARFVGGGRAVLLEILSPAVPSRGARRLLCRGELVLRVATRTSRRLLERVPIRPGVEVKGGGLALKITRIVPFGKRSRVTVVYQVEDPRVQLARLRFLAGGKEVASRSALATSWPAPRFVIRYTLERALNLADLELRLWTDVGERRVPFTFETGVGL